MDWRANSAAAYLLLHAALWTALGIVAGLSIADDDTTAPRAWSALLQVLVFGGMAWWSTALME